MDRHDDDGRRSGRPATAGRAAAAGPARRAGRAVGSGGGTTAGRVRPERVAAPAAPELVRGAARQLVHPLALLRSIGLTSNRMLLWGVAFEVVFAAALVGLQPLRDVFGTAVPEPAQLALLIPFPIVVWGTDELWRAQPRQVDGEVPGRRRADRGHR